MSPSPEADETSAGPPKQGPRTPESTRDKGTGTKGPGTEGTRTEGTEHAQGTERTGQGTEQAEPTAHGDPGDAPAAKGTSRQVRRRRALGIGAAVVAVLVVIGIVPQTRAAVGREAGAATDVALSVLPAPDVTELLDHLPTRNRVLAADGSLIATTWWQNRQVVATAQIAPVMRQAQVAIEDARYADHGSVDPIGLGRAVVSNLTSGDSTGQGGSTIEQQLAKNLVQLQAELSGDDAATDASTDKTVSRKLDDMVLAAHLARARSKDQLLTDYLNVVYYGEGAYGVQAAAERYFGTTADKLTLPQAALLAGLVQSPSAYDPLVHPEAALARRNVVLAAMREQGLMSAARYRAVARSALGLDPQKPIQGCISSDHPFFCAYAVSAVHANAQLGDSQATRDQAWKVGGLTVTTTLDPAVQKAADAAIKGRSLPSSLHDAVAVVRPGTGAVLALGQDIPYGTGAGRSTQSYAIDARDGGAAAFQGGSTFKTFTLATALAQGWNLDSDIDAPDSGTPVALSSFKSCVGLAGGTWAPRNAPGDPSGRMSLRTAFEKSVNTAFVALEADVGICEVRDLAQGLGVTQSDGQPLQPLPSLTLGASNTSPLTMASAYAAFAADGRFCAPTPVASVATASGTLSFASTCRRAVDPKVAEQVRDGLRAVVESGTGDGAAIDGVDVGGKTGTTDTSASTWFTGVTDNLAASVWVGDLSGGTHDRLYGGDIAAPLWRSVVTPVAGD